MTEPSLGEITITPGMILATEKIHALPTDPEERLQAAAFIFAAVLFSLPEERRLGITAVRCGGSRWVAWRGPDFRPPA